MRLRLRWTYSDSQFAELPMLYGFYLLAALVVGVVLGSYPLRAIVTTLGLGLFVCLILLLRVVAVFVIRIARPPVTSENQKP